MNRQTKIILLVIFILGALTMFRLIAHKPVSGKGFVAMRAADKVVVKIIPVRREDLSLLLSYVGSIKAKDEINVFSKATGKLVEYTVSEGDSVEKGQTIAYIDRDETGLKYELARVDSPISGVVGRTLQDKGANILTVTNIIQGAPLAVILNMDEMIVSLNIAEQDIPYFKKGLKAKIKVDAYPDEDFLGEVSKVSQIVDSVTRTLPVEVTIPNLDHRLKSGMFCRIKIVASVLKDRLVLTEDALVQESGVNYVFSVENQTAKKKKVMLGVKEDSRREVLEGLKEGERVIVFGQQGLKDGTAVEVIEE